MFLLEPQAEPWTTPHGIVTLQFTSEGLILSLIFASPGAPKGRDSVSFYSKFCCQQLARCLTESKCPVIIR